MSRTRTRFRRAFPSLGDSANSSSDSFFEFVHRSFSRQGHGSASAQRRFVPPRDRRGVNASNRSMHDGRVSVRTRVGGLVTLIHGPS